MQNNNSIGDIAVGVVAGVLNGVDCLVSERFWTHYQTKVVASRLLLPKYWNEDPLGNLGEIFTEALGKPISRKLRIKQDEYLYFNANNRIISTTSFELAPTSLHPLVKDDYKTSDNGSVQFERQNFPETTTDKKRRSSRVTIFKKKPEYADTVYGDSCIDAVALFYEDNQTMATAPKVIFSVTSATGEFEGVQGLELQTTPDGKRKFVLKWNGSL